MNDCPICIGRPPQRVIQLPNGSYEHTCTGCGYVLVNNQKRNKLENKKERNDDKTRQ